MYIKQTSNKPITKTLKFYDSRLNGLKLQTCYTLIEERNVEIHSYVSLYIKENASLYKMDSSVGQYFIVPAQYVLARI